MPFTYTTSAAIRIAYATGEVKPGKPLPEWMLDNWVTYDEWLATGPTVAGQDRTYTTPDPDPATTWLCWQYRRAHIEAHYRGGPYNATKAAVLREIGIQTTP